MCSVSKNEIEMGQFPNVGTIDSMEKFMEKTDAGRGPHLPFQAELLGGFVILLLLKQQ